LQFLITKLSILVEIMKKEGKGMRNGLSFAGKKEKEGRKKRGGNEEKI